MAAEDAEVGDHDEFDERADQRHQRARQDEEVVGRVDEQEPQVPPSVTDARQLRFAAPGVVLDGELREDQMLLGGADHHLGGELHPGGAQIELGQHVPPQRPHAAVGVVDPGAEEQVEEAGQQRVADVAVMPGHRAGMDVLHPVADHHVGAVLQFRDETGDLVEVVGEVGVRHHDVLPASDDETGRVGAAVAAIGLVDDDLRLLGFCDEIIVVIDDRTTDRTEELARQYTDNVHRASFRASHR